jgi:hypothetical protein
MVVFFWIECTGDSARGPKRQNSTGIRARLFRSKAGMEDVVNRKVVSRQEQQMEVEESSSKLHAQRCFTMSIQPEGTAADLHRSSERLRSVVSNCSDSNCRVVQSSTI